MKPNYYTCWGGSTEGHGEGRQVTAALACVPTLSGAQILAPQGPGSSMEGRRAGRGQRRQSPPCCFPMGMAQLPRRWAAGAHAEQGASGTRGLPLWVLAPQLAQWMILPRTEDVVRARRCIYVLPRRPPSSPGIVITISQVRSQIPKEGVCAKTCSCFTRVQARSLLPGWAPRSP